MTQLDSSASARHGSHCGWCGVLLAVPPEDAGVVSLGVCIEGTDANGKRRVVPRVHCCVPCWKKHSLGGGR